VNLYAPTTLVAERQFDYAFDDIDNRQTTTRDLRQASYSVNSLNQYTSRTVPGFVNVLGTATNTATVSLWSQDNLALYTPTTRQGDYFRGEMLVNNNTGALWLTITNVAVLSNYTGADIVTNTSGKLFVPKTAEVFGYDADGNLTNDGRWSYTWDAENRITSFTRNSAAPVGSRVKLDCQYDSKSRRTQKIVSTWNGSTYVAQSTNKFVYDGWNLIAILDSNSSLLASFQWGIDASGTLQGAGGVGGLLSMTVHQGTNAGTYLYCYDGNHNVTTLVNATNGAVAAQYEYDVFGRPLRATGPLAFVNPFTFSTKFCDWETGFLYYGYRYYDPPSQPTPQDSLNSEAWRMFIFLFAGDLGENYELSDSAIEAAKGRVNKDRIIADLRKAVSCNQSGTSVIKQSDNSFTIEENPGIVNMGNWQLRLRSTANWKCGNPVVEGGKCCCTCSADIHVKALMSKTYTFRANGYNPYNSSWGIRVLNGLAKDEQYYMRWYHDSDGPAFFISAEFDFSFSQSFKKCGKEQQP